MPTFPSTSTFDSACVDAVDSDFEALSSAAFLISPMFGRSTCCSLLYSGKIFRNLGCAMLKACDRVANVPLSAAVVMMLPVVISSAHIKDSRPTRLERGDGAGVNQRRPLAARRPMSTHMFATLQAGFQLPGWKSLIEVQILESV